MLITSNLIKSLVLAYLLMISFTIQSQNCDLQLGNSNTGHYDAFVDFRNDGVSVMKFFLYSVRVKAVQGRYKYHNYSSETNWEVLPEQTVYWPVINPPGLETKQSIIPWYDRNHDYYILISTRVQCADGTWTPWRDDDYRYGLNQGYPVFCKSDYWLESKNVGAHSVTFNYSYGAERMEVQLSEDGGRTWPISKTGEHYATSITISNLESNNQYHHRHRIDCGNWSYWAEYNADGAEITPFITDCAAPSLTEISTANVNSGTGIEVSCLANAQKYQYRIREKGNSSWSTSQEKTQNQHTFNNLSKFVVYEIQCKISCTVGLITTSMDWSLSKEHVIPGTCPVPILGDIGAKNIGTNTATLFCQSGHGDGIIERHKFRYRKNSESNWIEKTNTNNEVNINNLTNNTQYVMQVQHECTAATAGNWSSFQFFTTEQQCNLIPNQISIRNIGYDHADLICNVERAGYIWKYRKAGGGGLVELPQQTNERITITDLKKGTTYEVALKVFCDPAFSDGFTEWQTFTTLSCLTPDFIETTAWNITNHSATFYYSMGANEDHTWQYRKQGNQNWQSVQSVEDNTLIDGLTPNSMYEYRIRQNCDANTSSDWSTISIFTTPCDVTIRRFSNITSNSIKVYSTENGAQGYQFRYRIRGGTTWINTTTVLIPEVVVSNLNSTTEYEFQAAGTCINSPGSTWSPSDFATTRAPGLISNLNQRNLIVCDFPRKNELIASNITDRSAELGCSRGDVKGFIFRYAALKDTAWTLLEEQTNGTANLNGLSSKSMYIFQVKINCGSEVSEWSDTILFTTAASLESLSDQCFRPGLIQILPIQIGTNSVTLTCRVKVEKYQFRFRELTSISWVVLPEQTANAADVKALKPGANYEFQCKLFCNGGFGSYSNSWLFSTLSKNACDDPDPREFFSYEISQNEARLISLNKALQYQYRYKLIRNSSWTNSDTMNSPILELKDLEPGARYIYQLRLKCENNMTSNFSSVKSFTTLAACSLPDTARLKADSIKISTARIQYTDKSFLLYIFRYRPSNGVDWIYIDPGRSNVIQLHELKQNTKYEFEVSVDCNHSGYTKWSEPAFFTTALSTAIHTVKLFNIKVFPNPASDYLRIELPQPFFESKYSIFELSGRLIKQGEINYGTQSISLVHLPKGMYILQINQGKQFYQTKLFVMH